MYMVVVESLSLSTRNKHSAPEQRTLRREKLCVSCRRSSENVSESSDSSSALDREPDIIRNKDVFFLRIFAIVFCKFYVKFLSHGSPHGSSQ